MNGSFAGSPYILKGHILQLNMCPFGLYKVSFCAVKGHLLQSVPCAVRKPLTAKHFTHHLFLSVLRRSVIMASWFSMAHPISPLTCGSSERALSVSEYSTRGGTSGYTLRLT